MLKFGDKVRRQIVISIIDKIKCKPSKAIALSIQGVERLSQKQNYRVNMGTYGSVVDGCCCGCAATAAIQELAGRDLDEESIGSLNKRARCLGFSSGELGAFEASLNDARLGRLWDLFYFCGIEHCDKAKRCAQLAEDFYVAGSTEDPSDYEHSMKVLKYIYEILLEAGL